MKISEIYNLNKTQHELDFVDIDPKMDRHVFVDPFFLSTRKQPWCIDASRTIKSFFQHAIDLIKINDIEGARSIFINLNELNETCLGLSKLEPQGRGVGGNDAERIFESILESKAVETGLVEDLEDTAIFIDGISRDKVSDMATNIIKKHLIDYTQAQCHLWNIDLIRDVPSGFFWNAFDKRWDNIHTERLVIDEKPLLLVPKMAVSFHKDYVDKQYYQHFVLNFLQSNHLQKNSRLVKTRKLSKEKYVTKKDIIKTEAPFSKEFLRDFTKNHPEVFRGFREDKIKNAKPIGNNELEEIDVLELVDFLVNKLKSIKLGIQDANAYHKLIVGILEFIFYPFLNNPVPEKPINDGRKRIDITFDNAADNGFFYTLHNTHQITSRYIFVECKNYSEDPNNPEVDQLSGRFSVNTSKVGFLVCRKIENKKLFLKRCKDIWKQKNELVIPLTDEDVVAILEKIKQGIIHPEEKILNDLRREIVLS